jgi:hypothetical protein
LLYNLLSEVLLSRFLRKRQSFETLTRILMGDHNGKVVMIPRIALNSVTKTLPIIQRLQFLVRLAFALTINKVCF